MVSRTRLTSPAYDGAVADVLEALGRDARAFWSNRGSEGIVFLRAAVMNPFATCEQPDYMTGLVNAVRNAALRVMTKASERPAESLACA